MASSRGSSEKTRGEILKAARELFAERGINLVSIRDIGAAAGVNHALVHRYFGSKEEMVADILRRECEVADSMSPPPSAAAGDALEGLRQMLLFAMAEGRTTIKLITRAELTGLEPEKMLDGDLRPLRLLSAWIGSQQSGSEVPEEQRFDPALVSAVLGGALFSMVTLAPWLMTAVGLKPEDAEIRRQEIADILVDLVARAAGVTSTD